MLIDALVSTGATSACSLEGFVTTGDTLALFSANRYERPIAHSREEVHPHVVECSQETTAVENELSRVVNAVPVLIWTARPLRRRNTGTLQAALRRSRQRA